MHDSSDGDCIYSLLFVCEREGERRFPATGSSPLLHSEVHRRTFLPEQAVSDAPPLKLASYCQVLQANIKSRVDEYLERMQLPLRSSN